MTDLTKPTAMQLFTAVDANADSALVPWPGGLLWMILDGDIGSGDVDLQYSPDGGTTVIDSGLTTDAVGITSAYIPKGLVRLSLSGSTNPDLNGWIANATPRGV